MLRNSEPLGWMPSGLTDKSSGTDAFAGAANFLQNLIPSPTSRGKMVCRPAGAPMTSLGGNGSALLTVGDMAYGMRASVAHPGFDEPFAENLLTGTLLPISGITGTNLPVTQPTTGDTIQPQIAQVASRIIFTHPGFAGGTATPISFIQVVGNVHNGTPTIDGSPMLPSGALLTVGQALFGTGIAVGATVISSQIVSLQTTATGTSGNNFFTVAVATGIAIGQGVFSPSSNLLAGSKVTNVVGTTITINNNLTGNLAGDNVFFSGATVTMSVNGTASNNGVTISVVGGVQPHKFGWLDLSGTTITTYANTITGSPVLTGAPTIIGVQPGMSISGANIPAGTVVSSTGALVITATGTLNSTQTVTGVVVSDPVGAIFAVGQAVVGAGIQIGTTVLAYSAGTLILSLPATVSGPATLAIVGSLIVMSAAATGTGSYGTVTIAGGTPSAPLWGAGDTNINGLAAVPVWVSQFNGRAYFGVNTTTPTQTSGTSFSDPGFGCQISSATQTLLFQDGVPTNAAAGLALFNQLGGIVQSLMVFQGASNIRQITGDAAFGNLTVNSLQTATGTDAPNSIAPTPKGLLFVAPDGIRLIDFDARVSDPIGWRGDGLSLPFLGAVTPTRMSGAYNENIYRVSLSWVPPPEAQATWGTATRRDEFWLHLDLGRFTGPHTLTSSQIVPWQSTNSFVLMPDASPAALWRSDPAQSSASIFVELGVPLDWVMTTILFPDAPTQKAICILESAMYFAMGNAAQALVTAYDDRGNVLDQVYVWAGPDQGLEWRPIPWSQPVVGRQVQVRLEGTSSNLVQLGNLSLHHELVDMMIPAPSPPEFILGTSVLGNAATTSVGDQVAP